MRNPAPGTITTAKQLATDRMYAFSSKKKRSDEINRVSRRTVDNTYKVERKVCPRLSI